MVSLDPLNAARAVIGSVANGTQGNGLTFTPNGTLYVAGPTGPGNLYTVDRTTGVITTVVTLSNVPVNFGSSINAMASDAQGLLYVTGRGIGHQLATINPTTGVMTSVGILPFEADALAFSPIPEPSVSGLLAAGLLLAWSIRAVGRTQRQSGAPREE